MSIPPKYGKFWDRVGAYILDSITIGAFAFGLNYLNIIYAKSFLIYLVIAIATMLYKPFMESYYSATLGKMALNLKVTDLNYNKINFEKSLLRSLIVIIPSLIYIPIHYLAFYNPEVVNADGLIDFSMRLDSAYPKAKIFSKSLSLIFIADAIVLLTETSGKQRSLKDFIAKTYVIKAAN